MALLLSRLTGACWRVLFLSSGVVAVAVASPASAVAQRVAAERGAVQGDVRDAATGEPLAFARVRLVEWHREVVTHTDGHFAFTGVPVGAVTVAVQRIGYGTSTRSAVVTTTGTVRVEVALLRSAAQLAATVVTGSVDEKSVENSLSTTTVVSGAALDRMLNATVSATLAGTPGFVATSMGPATARPVLRGLGGDRVLLLEDGARPGDLSATAADHATAVEPIGAKQIEVVRGPMSLLYGPNALGGVVNVISDLIPTSRPEDTHGTLSVQGGTVQPGGTLAGSLALARGNTAWRVEGSARRAGDLQTPEGTMGNTQLATYSGAIGASRVSDGGHVGASLRSYYSSYGLPGGFTGAHPNGVDIQMWRHTLRVESERHPARGPFTTVKGSAQYTLYGHDEIGTSGNVAVSFLQNLAAFEGMARHGAWGPARSGAIGARAQLRRVDVGGANRATDTGDWNLAAFAVQEYGDGPLTAQAGLRYDVAQYVPLDTRRTVQVGGGLVPVRSRTFGALSGSVGALWQVIEGVKIGASAARAFRTPDFNELYSDGPHLAAYSYDVGNPNIRQETGFGTEAFVRVTRSTVQLEASVFRNHLTDFIFARNTGEIGRQGLAPKFQYVNTDAVFTGADGAFTWAPTSTWVVEGSASYVRAERLSVAATDSVPATTTPTDTFPAAAASRALPWIPPLQGTIGTRWEHAHWFAGATLKVATRQARTGDYERPTDGYQAVGLVMGMRLLIGRHLHAITLRVDNAGNTLYRDHLARTKVVLPEAGRNLSVLYRVSL